MTVESALRAAEAMPTLPAFTRQDRVAHPWPVASSKVYGRKVSRQEAVDAPVEKVPLAELHGVQRGVGRKKLEQYIREGGRAPEGAESHAGYPRDLPIVVRTGGRLYIHDGHHRLTAQQLLGRRVAECRVVDIEPHPLTRWAHAGT